MGTVRESLTTLIDFEDGSFDGYGEPESLVRRRTDLSGGATMWQARLVLSTLDPQTNEASELRIAIRRGDINRADELLHSIYSTKDDMGPAKLAKGPKSTVALTTVLPPSPSWHKLGVG